MFGNEMFSGQEAHAVMATALNHASTAMHFALEHMDEYTEHVHRLQANGTIAAGDWDNASTDAEPIAPDVLRHDLAMAAMLLHGLSHVAQDRAEDVQVRKETGNIDAELKNLLG